MKKIFLSSIVLMFCFVLSSCDMVKDLIDGEDEDAARIATALSALATNDNYQVDYILADSEDDGNLTIVIERYNDNLFVTIDPSFLGNEVTAFGDIEMYTIYGTDVVDEYTYMELNLLGVPYPMWQHTQQPIDNDTIMDFDMSAYGDEDYLSYEIISSDEDSDTYVYDLVYSFTEYADGVYIDDLLEDTEEVEEDVNFNIILTITDDEIQKMEFDFEYLSDFDSDYEYSMLTLEFSKWGEVSEIVVPQEGLDTEVTTDE